MSYFQCKNLLLEGSRPDNSPDFMLDGRLLRANDLSLSADMQQFTKLGQNRKFDGRLLELDDPSPRDDVRQFTKLGQNHKSKMVHLEGSTRNNSPDSVKITRLLEQEDPSPRVEAAATIHQIGAKSK
eukprot:scaffold4873_cov84-Cylindrotheca_fusiformis.AAC.1